MRYSWEGNSPRDRNKTDMLDSLVPTCAVSREAHAMRRRAGSRKSSRSNTRPDGRMLWCTTTTSPAAQLGKYVKQSQQLFHFHIATQ